MAASPEVQLRLWPGVLLLAVQWLLILGAPLVDPNAHVIGVLGGLATSVAVLLWWVFASRAPRVERFGALALLVAVPAAASPFLHDSIRTGMMGLMYFVYLAPILSLILVGWAVLGRRLAATPRRAALAVAVVAACGGWLLLRTDGITSAGSEGFRWRWSETAEERLLAAAAPLPTAPVSFSPPPAAEPAPGRPAPEVSADRMQPPPAPEPEWPGFRGAQRDGIVRGRRIETDWVAKPPQQLWRRPVGPGWSSFAVAGDLFYTQEQRGEEEIVTCYRVSTGEPVWSHADPVRFWEANAGAGPRATPTLSGGRVYTLGATGILNALDATDGTLAWSRNAGEEAEKQIPGWGFSGSPLVLGGTVIAAAAGRLAAYDRDTGEPRWLGPDGGGGYSSPHRAVIGSVEQVLLMNKMGATSVSPDDGQVLWEHAWEPKSRIVQPALLGDDGLLISGGERTGLRRLKISRGPEGWRAAEVWTSFQLKPYFNDFVVHQGHAYGFDGRILACIDIATGERRWKGGRYGQGQLILLTDQDLLLALSEDGELALVKASPEGFAEIARHRALQRKTWNHPALAGDTLLVRNDEEMAAFRL